MSQHLEQVLLKENLGSFRSLLKLPKRGRDGRERLRNSGVTLSQLGTEIEISNVKFGSRAKKLGVEQGYKIAELKLPNPRRPSPYWIFPFASLLAWGVWWLQGRRLLAATKRD